MPVLPKNPNLTDLQRYVAELEIERGFSRQDIFKKCLLLGEEIGELFKAVRKQEGLSVDVEEAKGSSVADELADVLIMICAVANRIDVNLEQAFRSKEAVNHERTWTKES